MATTVNGVLQIPTALSMPQGRLAPSTGTPVPAASVTAATSVFYCLYNGGNQIPIWNGNAFVMTTFTELSNVLANSSVGNAGPAAGAAAKVYDLFVSVINGVITLTRDVAWTNDTTPVAGGTGPRAGLNLTQGILVNANTITNGPAAGFGTYVGTIRTDAGGATVSTIFGASGTAGFLGVWNAYNRVNVRSSFTDQTATWTYTTGTIRQSRASATNQITLVRGLDEDAASVLFVQEYTLVGGAVAANVQIYVGLDSTTAAATLSAGGVVIEGTTTAAPSGQVTASWAGQPGLGAHVFAALEKGDTVNANTFNGQAEMLFSVVTRY